MAFYFASEKNKREVNEDSYCQMELRINLEASVSAMVVADGMGGPVSYTHLTLPTTSRV